MDSFESVPEPRFRGRLNAQELDLARRVFGNLPRQELTNRLYARWEQEELEQFGSFEAADAHYEQMREIEASMVARHKVLEQRVRELNGFYFRSHSGY